MEWIRVKDRLPDQKGHYLLAIKGKDRGMLGHFWTTPPRWSWSTHLVTHWMPLPELPKQEMHDEQH